MLARCSILERLSSRACQGATHNIGRYSPTLSRRPGTPVTRQSYDLLRIGGVRHYAVRSKEKRKALREARSPPKPCGEPSMEYISSWDLDKDTLLYVRVEEPFHANSAEASGSSGSGSKICRNRWPTISTLDPNLIGPADYVNISNMDRPKIICYDGREMVSCVVEYGRKKIRKAKTVEKKDSSKTAAPSASPSSSSRLGEKASEPEPPPPPPRQHPLGDGDYVDSVLLAHEPYQPEGVAQAGPSLSTVHEAPSSPASHSDLDKPRPSLNSLTLLLGREPGRAEPELSDPSFRSLLSQERKRLRKSEDGWKRSEEKERIEREAYLHRSSEAGVDGDGRGLGTSLEGKKGGRVKRGRSRSRERLGRGKDAGKDGKKAAKGKSSEPAATYERIPFPPGTKGFFYFYKPSPPMPAPPPPAEASSTSTSPTSSSPSISTSTRPTANNHAQTQTPSPASGALRFRVLPLPLTDPRAFEESYDLPSPHGAIAGPWEVPLLVLRERGGMDVPEGERVGARGPLEGFWRLLFKTASAAVPSTSTASQRPSPSLSAPSKPSNPHPALLTPSEASQIDSLLPPYMPRIGPHTKVLQSVLDPFVMDLSVNDMSVVVVDALRRPSSSPSSSSSSLTSSSSSSSSSSPSSKPIPTHEQQPHKIHYTKFENMLVPLSWSHHRGPYTYNTPAHIPISKRFMTDRPALKTLLWKRRRKSPWTGQALVRFELTPPPTSKSIHAHPLLALRILKYVVPPDPQPVWKRPKPQVVGRLVSRWKPQGRMHLSPWHPQRVRYPFPEEVMQVLQERYWKPEWVEGRTRRRGVSYRERKAKEVREGKGRRY
ncbi:hypothetical protein BKA70DRAFT_1563403 [Coprinopsis sp. MPI-PUGE-AT-0042]|nr:hypothetical protein BKA70DRAFT_1563403 [Coprinopsis sp. MPI-PUGE-AT-0042]